MADCIHCGTPFSPGHTEEKFCCRGCEFVHELIKGEGLERFYDLRSSSTVRPARSVPFESHDFSWLESAAAAIEEKSTIGDPAEGDFSLEGLSCVGCVWLVEKVFLRQPGALEASAHPATGALHLRWTAGTTDLPAFAREIASFGYAMTPPRKGASNSETRQLGFRLGLCAAFAMNAMVFTLPRYVGMPADFAFAHIFQLVAFLSAMLSMLTGGTYFIRRAWLALRERRLHIDLPIALGILSAFTGSIIGWAQQIEGLLYFDFVSMFIFLMLGGRFLQISAIEKNRSRLQRHQPVPETVHSPDRPEAIPLSEISPGMRFELSPGQSVPVASVLDSTAADFSLEWISGEADPQTFHPGRRLPAGAIYLGASPVLLTAGETWEDSLLARLTSTRRTAARVPALEKLLRFYLIAVLIIGAAGFVWWLLHGTTAHALQVMISVFVVSCPCALGVALPLADELCGSIMERAGVFIRESLLWSRLNQVRTLIFDKTGTLTLERPLLSDPESVTMLDEEAKLSLARLTSDSLHPVSRSLLESLGHQGQRLLREHPPVEVHDVPGSGRYFIDGDTRWSLGRPGWQSSGNPADGPPSHDAELRRNDEIVCRFHFQESLRPDAIAALEALRRKRFRLVILSGDRSEKVAAAASLLDIPEADAHAGLQPDAKEALVSLIDRRDTLFLGDGANDSLAFNAAWTTGTPVVDRSLLEAKADFYFLGQGLRFLPQLLSLAGRRRRAVRCAFAFALLYNFAAVAAALSGHMNPLVAAIIMPLSSVISLSIVACGLREKAPRRGKVAQSSIVSYDPPGGLSAAPGGNDQRSPEFRTNGI